MPSILVRDIQTEFDRDPKYTRDNEIWRPDFDPQHKIILVGVFVQWNKYWKTFGNVGLLKKNSMADMT